MILRPLNDPALENSLATLSPDGVTRFVLAPRGAPEAIRGVLINGSRAVCRMRANHALAPVETLVLGRALLCAGLMACGLKDEGSIALRIDGDGPAEGLTAEGRITGPAAGAPGAAPTAEPVATTGVVMVRGHLFKNPIPFPELPERLGSADLFGRGALTVTRFAGAAGTPFSGSVTLKGSGIASNLASYYHESEQTRTALDSGIQFDREGRPRGAGALLLQALPGADPDFVGAVEDAMSGLPPLGLWFSQGGTRADFVGSMFGRFGARMTDELGFSFSCPCSRERFGSYLAALDRASLADLAERGPWPVETVCHQCASRYHFERAEVEAMLAARGA